MQDPMGADLLGKDRDQADRPEAVATDILGIQDHNQENRSGKASGVAHRLQPQAQKG